MRTTVKIVACLLIGFPATVSADVRLPSVFGNHMILQQQTPIRIFGWAEPGERVIVELNANSASTISDKDGRFRVELPAMNANGKSLTLTIKGNNTTQLTDVVLGEVWICSGQSNMELALRSTMNAEQELATANHPDIRLFNVPGHISSPTPKQNTPGKWQACTSETSPQFSAVGYFFGRMLMQELEVPIGLIGTNWGGTRIEPWIPPVGFNSVAELSNFSMKLRQMDASTPEGIAYFKDYINNVQVWVDKSHRTAEAGKDIGNPPRRMTHQQIAGATTIYNGMIHGLAPFSVKGAIWYQGESNGNEGESYFHKMKALINGWRTVFDNNELAFHFVQLADFQNPNNNPAGNDGWAKLREAQRKTLTLPNTGMAVIIDIGNALDIHPRNKQDVGARLARWALHQTYGRENVVPSGPLYKSHSVEGSKVNITFDHAGSGLMVGKRKDGLNPTQEDSEGILKRFAIAGSDKVWHWANARIVGDVVVVWSDDVPDPVAIRYAFSMNPAGANLYNKEGLPASPFRTDNW